MKRLISFVIALIIVVFAWSEKYKILQMNTATVKIGKRICKQGDKFSDTSVIYWSKEKQAIKAQNIKTKEIRWFTQSEFQSKNCKTITDYFVKNKRASSRDGLGSIKEMFHDTFYLSDTITFSLYKKRSYYIKYQYKGECIRKDLPFIKECFIIDKSMFPKDNDCNEYRISVFRTEENKEEEDYCYTDEMIVVLIPEWIEE